MHEEELQQKIESLEARVAVLEAQINGKSVEPVANLTQSNHPYPMLLTTHDALNPPIGASKIGEKNEIDWEKQLGQVWLPRIFIFVLLVGLIWGFKAAVDYGVLTPPMRIVIGYIFGGLLYGLGERQVKQKRRILGIVLISGAVTTMMITTFAMQMLYHMMPALPAMGLNLIWIIGGFFLAIRHKTETLGILVGIGGYLIPFLVHSAHPSIYGFAIFEFVLFMGYVLIAIQQNYRVLFHVSNYLLSLTYLASLFLSGGWNVHSSKILASFILGQFVLMTALYFYKTLFKNQYIAMYTLSALSSAWLAATFQKPIVLSVLAIGIVIYLIGFLQNYRTKEGLKEKHQVTLTIASYFLAIWFVRLFEHNESALYLSVLIEGVALTLLALNLKSRLHEILGVILVSASTLGILTEHYTDFWSFKIFVLFVFTVSYGVLYTLFKKEGTREKVLISGVAFVSALIIFLSISTQTITDSMSFEVQNVTLSCVWGVFAFLSAVYGQVVDNRKMRIFGMVAIFGVLIKIVLNDIADLSTTVRAALFIALGIVGMIMSRIYYIRNSDKKKT